MRKLILGLAYILLINLPVKVDATPVLTFNDYTDGTKILNESYGGNSNNPTVYDSFEVSLNEEPITENSKIKITSSQCYFWSSREGNLGPSYTTLVGPATGGSYSNGKTLRTAAVAIDDNVYEGNHSCTVTATVISDDPSFSGLTVSKNFSISDNDAKPIESSQPSSTNSTPTTTQANSTPTTKLVDSKGNEIKPEEGSEKIVFKDSEPVIISGVTVPNGIVKIYIFSEPQEAEVIADADGNWTYTIENIEPGDHRVEVEVTDPATNETSERAEVLAFSVAQVEESNDVAEISNENMLTNSEEESSLLPVIVIASILVLAGAASGFWFWKKKYSTPNITEDNAGTTNILSQSSSVEDRLEKSSDIENEPVVSTDEQNHI